LLALPHFLDDVPGCGITIVEAKAAWKLADFFLMRDVYLPRGIAMPDARAAFQVYALKGLTQ
jgi:hypothetical protein